MGWWLDTYSIKLASHERNKLSVRKHLIDSNLAKLRLVDVTPGAMEQFLHAKGDKLSPQTVNHLRAFVMSAFSAAKKAGKFSGLNPVRDVARRKVPRRAPAYLGAHEVLPVLVAVPSKWRSVFATAIYTGLRRGEILGLRKQDVDLRARLLTVARSYDRDTTKGGHADVIPIAQELVPYLEEAMKSSPSELIFPTEDGTMFSSHTPLEDVLRRAMKRAGLVLGYEHVCRRKTCTHKELANDATLRRCPKHGMKLWPKARLRPIRFHDLRHTTASLLMMAGANPAAVQRILRHQDPRITTEVYGHLAPDYLRAEIDRLRFHAPDESTKEPVAEASRLPFGPMVVPRASNGVPEGDLPNENTPKISAKSLARHRRFELLTYGYGGVRIVLLSSATAAMIASARPLSAAPVSSVIA
jgi:integrase